MSLYVDCRAQHYVYSKTCNSESQQIQIYKKANTFERRKQNKVYETSFRIFENVHRTRITAQS